MANHHKPTKEQLKAGMDKSLEDLKNLPPDDQNPGDGNQPPATPPGNNQPPATPPDNNQPPATPPNPPELKLDDVRAKKPEDLSDAEKTFIQQHSSELTDEEKTAFGVTTTPPANNQPPANQQQTDWEKKFRASSREAQLMGYKNKELNKAIEDAAALATPTDEEMKKVHAKWDELDDFQKSLARDNELNKRKFNLITNATAKFKQVDDWTNKVNDFVTNPQTLINHPLLEGKEDLFRDFASKESRRNLDFDDLVLAFRGEIAANPPANHQGQQMFETGGNRAPTPPQPKDDRLSPSEGEALRKTDYKKYVQLLKAGKIRNT